MEGSPHGAPLDSPKLIFGISATEAGTLSPGSNLWLMWGTSGVALTQPAPIPCPSPARPRSACHHLQVLDEFARENIHSLYKFNFSGDRDVLCAGDRVPLPAFYLDRTIRLQRLSQPGHQNKVGFRLVSVPGPERSWHGCGQERRPC